MYKKDLSVEKINSAFKGNFISKQNKKILEMTEEKLVSIDFNHNPASLIIDASLTNVVGKKWEKFLLGMIMSGDFLIGCVI